MRLLKEISEIDIGLTDATLDLPNNIRRAARMILFNHMNQIAVLYASKDKYHKLPGGGIEKSESVHEALKREVREEVGANIEVLGEIGVTIEYRGQFLQLSYCYYGKVVGEIENPSFTDEEESKGFELKWLGIDTAIKTLSADNPVNYVGKFVHKRDLYLLNSYKGKLDLLKL